MAEMLWQPGEERKRNANLTRFIEFVNSRYGTAFTTYEDLYCWSVEDIPAFWDLSLIHI